MERLFTLTGELRGLARVGEDGRIHVNGNPEIIYLADATGRVEAVPQVGADAALCKNAVGIILVSEGRVLARGGFAGETALLEKARRIVLAAQEKAARQLVFPPHPEPQLALGPEPQLVLEPESQPASEREFLVASEPEFQLVSKPESQLALEPEPQSVLEPEAQLVLEPEPQLTFEPESRPALESEPQPSPVQEPGPVSKAGPRPHIASKQGSKWAFDMPDLPPEGASQALIDILAQARKLFGPLEEGGTEEQAETVAAAEALFDPFPGVFPGAEWRRVPYPGTGRHYLEGHWRRGAQRYVLHALPGEYAPVPPVRGFNRFLRARDGSGYWIRVRRQTTTYTP